MVGHCECTNVSELNTLKCQILCYVYFTIIQKKKKKKRERKHRQEAGDGAGGRPGCGGHGGHRPQQPGPRGRRGLWTFFEKKKKNQPGIDSK